MKRTLVFLITLIAFSYNYAQENAIEKYFTEHLENPAFAKFSVTGKTFDLITEIETDDAEEQRVLDAIGKIKGITVLTNDNTEISLEYYTDAVSKLVPDAAYEDLMVVEHEQVNVRFLVRENETAIQEFVMVMGEETHFVIASIYGEIDIASMSKIMGVLRTDKHKWFDLFQNIDSEELVFGNPKNTSNSNFKNNISTTSLNNLKLKIYPNPSTDFINIAPEKGTPVEMNVAFYSLMGKEVQNLGKVTLPHQVRLNELPAGAYFLRLTDKDGIFKNFRIVKPGM